MKDRDGNEYVEEYKQTNNSNAVHQYLVRAESYRDSLTARHPEALTPFDQIINLYIDKLKNQGRKGKKLSQRTLINYEGRLEFWRDYFGKRPAYQVTLKELGEIQDWLPWLMPNYKKRGQSTEAAILGAKEQKTPMTSFPTRPQRNISGSLKPCFNLRLVAALSQTIWPNT